MLRLDDAKSILSFVLLTVFSKFIEWNINWLRTTSKGWSSLKSVSSENFIVINFCTYYFMRFLKNKVISKMALMPPQHESSEEEDIVETKVKVEEPQKLPMPEPPKKKESWKDPLSNYLNSRSSVFTLNSESQEATTNSNTKNIVKNYGKAMCSFAASNLSLPYLEIIVKSENIKLDRFKEYFRCKKELVGSIESFRNLYIEDATDNEEIKAFKRIFQKISIIFIKNFSVNWIFNGKLTQKQAHLKYRYKMLRRIQNPEQFTYLKG